MVIALKVIAAIICVIALIVTFRTENFLKTVFRVETVSENMIFKTKLITLIIVAVLFITVMVLK